MFIVGLTGGLASGKSTVASMLREFGATVLDADRLAHQQFKKSSVRQEVVKAFGKEILKRGEINRRALAQIVFNDATKLRQLEAMIHPAVICEMIQRIEDARKKHHSKIFVIDVPLLFETGLEKYVDATIVVKASRAVQRKRARHLSLSAQEVKNRIHAQMPLAKKIRLADFIIDNNGDLEKTKLCVKEIWKKISQKQNT